MRRILGVTDCETTCWRCGRQGLEKTIVVDNDGDTEYYGCECVKKVILGIKGTPKKIIKEIEENSVEKAREEYNSNEIVKKYKENKKQFLQLKMKERLIKISELQKEYGINEIKKEIANKYYTEAARIID